MSLVVLDADVDVGAVETENGAIPVITLDLTTLNKITDEQEEVSLLLTVGNANALGQFLVATTINLTETAHNQEESTDE